MGVDFYAKLVYGVPLEEMFRTEETVEQVTRFNEITGQPYLLDVVTNTNYLCDKPIGELFIALEKAGLSSHYCDYETKENVIVGEEITRCEQRFPVQIVEFTIGRKQDILQKFGRLGYEGEVRLFLMLECSY